MFGERSHRQKRHLETSGVHGTATVLEIGRRGMAITHGAEGVVANTEIAVKLRLRVEAESRPAFEVQTKLRFPQLALPQVGHKLPVIFDPDDHETLMLDESPAGQMAAMSEQLKAQGLRQDQVDSIAAAQQMALAGADPEAIVARVNEIRAAAGQPPAQTFGGPQPVDPIDQLAKLADLRDRGVLTELEFQAQKQAILNRTANPPA